MSSFWLVAAVIVAFFVIGIGVGVIGVIALAALRRDRYRAVRGNGQRAGPRSPLGWPTTGTDWREPRGPGQYGGYEEDESGNGPPRWPGR
jgi:hypothetical protein